jgi:hypothetical protein
MTNEALKLVQSKQDFGLIIPMYIINIHGLFNINNEIYYYLKNNIIFVKIIISRPIN